MLVEILVLMAGMMLATVGQWMLYEETLPWFPSFSAPLKHEWISRITSSVVEIALVAFALLQGHTSQWGVALLVAYLLHDTGHMMIYDTDISSYLHHLISMTVLGLMQLTMTPAQAHVTTQAMAILESTSPFLHATWLLKQAGYGKTALFPPLAALATVIFGVLRCGVFPWLMATRMDGVTTFIFAPLMGLNLYWFTKLISLATKVMRGAGTPESVASCSEQSPAT